VSHAAGIEVEAEDLVSRVVLIVIQLKTRREEGGVDRVVKIVVTPEQAGGFGQRIIQAGHQFILDEWRLK
jgi:hypothetical protein